MKNFFSTLVILLFCSISIIASEPKNNLGKSFQYVKSNDPTIVHFRNDGNRQVYGATEDGISTIYTFEDDIVVEECLMIQSNDGFARDCFNSFLESFQKTEYRKIVKTSNGYKFMYSYFDVKIIYFPDYSGNTTMVLYTTDFTY